MGAVASWFLLQTCKFTSFDYGLPAEAGFRISRIRTYTIDKLGVNFDDDQKRQPALTGSALCRRFDGGLQHCSGQLFPRNENLSVSLSRVCEELFRNRTI